MCFNRDDCSVFWEFLSYLRNFRDFWRFFRGGDFCILQFKYRVKGGKLFQIESLIWVKKGIEV